MPSKETGPARKRFTRVPGGADRPASKSFDARSVDAIDLESSDWLLLLFDSFGFPPLQPVRGRWDGDRLVLEKTAPRGVGCTISELTAEGFAYSVASRTHEAAEFMPVMDEVFRKG